MLKNYIKIAFRNLFKQKVHSFINIFGLAVGLACFILILLFVQHELSYDHFHKNSDRIYRVVKQDPEQLYMGTDYFAVTPAPLASTLVKDYPEVTSATAFAHANAFLGHDDQLYREKGLWADEYFLNVFTFPLLRGNSKTALSDPNSVIITESLAHKLFGEEEAMGQVLVFSYQNPNFVQQEQTERLTITGIMSDVPVNSSIKFSFITPISLNPQYVRDKAESQWNSNNYNTFFVLKSTADPTQFQTKMPELVKKYGVSYSNNPDDLSQYIIRPLHDVHLHSRFNHDFGGRGDIMYVYLFLAIGFVILLLACVNYTNLAVARSIKRAREVGMRKVVGAWRHQLIVQFLSESVIIAFLALVLALGMVDLLLPFFGHLMERPIQMDFAGNDLLLPALLMLIVLVGLLSGSYPAFFMASLRPMQVLAGKKDNHFGRFRIQRLLIVAQYAVSIAFVTGIFVVYQQMQFVQQKNLGYDREHVVTIRINDETLRENYEVIRDEWLRNPNIAAVGFSAHLPTNIPSSTILREWEGSSEGDALTIFQTTLSYDFIDVFGMELMAGRTFSRDVGSDAKTAYIINETAARAFGWTSEEAIGKHVTHNGRSIPGSNERTIIGVVKDFHFQSMHRPIEPLVILLDNSWMQYIFAKVRTDNLPVTVALMGRSVKQFTSYPFEYQFLDDSFDQLYKDERRLGEIFGFFTVLALLIASLGLFGLAAYAAEQRTKEIGVRKVLGVTVANIVGLLSKDFLKLVLIGFVIAVPVAWYIMNRWLQDFAYRIEIGPGVFLLAGGAVVLIAIVTVSWQSIKAALMNPVNSLRSE